MGLFSNKPKEPALFETNYLGFWIRVYLNRVEFKSGVGSQSIPINQIASVQLGMMGLMSIVLETSGGKKYKIPCIKKQEVQQAIYNAQSRPTSNSDTHSVQIGAADEIIKLNELKEKGIISEEEFDHKKKQLLGNNATKSSVNTTSLPNIPAANSPQAAANKSTQTNSITSGKILKVLKIVGWVLLAIFALAIWYISIPILVAWYLFKKRKNKFSQRVNIIITVVVVVIFAGLGIFVSSSNSAPTLTISEPQNGSSVEVHTITIKGKIDPTGSAVKINGKAVQVAQTGEFSQEVQLPNEQNPIDVTATHGTGNRTVTLNITRILTAEEKAAADKVKADAEAQQKAAQEAEAKKKAEEEAAKKEEEQRSHTSTAKFCAQEQVKEMLKAPSTADFPWLDGWAIAPQGGDVYKVQSYVDAENSYGAKIRSNFSCDVIVVDPSNYSCISDCKLQ